MAGWCRSLRERVQSPLRPDLLYAQCELLLRCFVGERIGRGDGQSQLRSAPTLKRERLGEIPVAVGHRIPGETPRVVREESTEVADRAGDDVDLPVRNGAARNRERRPNAPPVRGLRQGGEVRPSRRAVACSRARPGRKRPGMTERNAVLVVTAYHDAVLHRL